MGPGVGSEQFACCRFGSGSEKRSFLVEHNVNGDVGQQFLEFFFFAESGNEFATLNLRQNLRRNTAGDEHATACERLKCQVAGFGAVQGDEKIQCFDADGTSTLETQARDFGRRVRSGLIKSGVADTFVQEFVQCEKTAAGNNQLEAEKSMQCLQIPKQFDLSFGSRSKIRVPAFAWHHNVAVAIPRQYGFSQPGTGSDQGLGAMRSG